MKFLQMELDENLQIAEMLYQYGEKNFLYVVSAGYYNSSFGFDADDKIIDKEIVEIDGNDIELTKYQVKQTGTIKCSVHFTYRELEYFMTGKLETEEFKKIIKKLYFL